MLDSTKIDLAVLRIHAIAHSLRMQIVFFLNKNPEAQVKEIYSALGIEQSVCSQHLKILRDAEIVTCERLGKTVKYNLNYPVVKIIMPALEEFFAKE